jgi:hypothetical protein
MGGIISDIVFVDRFVLGVLRELISLALNLKGLLQSIELDLDIMVVLFFLPKLLL